MSLFSERLAEWASSPDFRASAKARSVARESIVDTLACIIAGAQEPQSLATQRAILSGYGSGNVRPEGGGEPLSLMGAAMLNAVRAHAIDFDDYEIPGSTHPSAPLLGALFPLARARRLTVDEVSDAWIVGYEAITWMGTALGFGHYDKGWHATSTLGPIGTAAAISRALRLSAPQMSHAMALAASSSAGLKAQFGFDAKALHVGFAAESGMRAALLAQSNATGNVALWDAPQGFIALYGTPASPGFTAMMQNMTLGDAVARFPVARKLWPSCSYTQRAIWGAEQMYQKLPPSDPITAITVRMPEAFHRVAHFNAPQSDAEARFSVRYCTAAGIMTGQVTPDDFRPDRYLDEERQRMTRLVGLDLYALPPDHSGALDASTMETISVTLASGRMVSIETPYAPGCVDMPMTRAQLLRKATDCGCSASDADAFFEADGGTALADTVLFKTPA